MSNWSRRNRPAWKLLSMAAVTSLLAGSIAVVGATATAPPAAAIYAEGGSGEYPGLINWISWEGLASPIPNDSQVSTTHTVGGQTIETVCTISDISASAGWLEPYVPGSWRNDGLDDLYNIGGTGSNNQMQIGLANSADRATVDFRVSCESTLQDGQNPPVAIPMAGLVVADAESSNWSGGQQEYIEATPVGATDMVTWHLIERFRTPGCTQTSNAIVDGEQLTLRPPTSGGECDGSPSTGEGGGPMAIAFMQGASAADIEFRGGGYSAVALGVVLAHDFGDAPIEYGAAGALYQNDWSGGALPQGTTKPQGTTNVFGASTNLSVPSQPPIRLGAEITSEDGYPDDADGTNDEGDDAIAPLGNVAVSPGQQFTQEVVCYGGGAVAGWVDWNGNQTFDSAERSDTVTCNSVGANPGTATLTWTVPEDVFGSVAGEASFMRLRTAADASQIAEPTGISTTGEVEDHPLDIITSTLTLHKNVVDRYAPEDAFELTIRDGDGIEVATATATTPATGLQTQSAGPVAVIPGATYHLSETGAIGTNLDLYDSEMVCLDSGGASVPVTADGPGAWLLTYPVAAAGEGEAIACTITNTALAHNISLTKSADLDIAGDYATAGDIVDYTLTATNTGTAALSGVTITDPMLGGELSVDPAAWPGAEGVLEPTQSVTVTVPYTLTQADVDRGWVDNEATVTGNPSSGDPVEDTADALVNLPSNPAIELVKQGTVASDVVAGEAVDYSFTVTNTGNVTLTAVELTDPLLGGSVVIDDAVWPGAVGELAPEEWITVEAQYELTQADIDAGSVINTAVATGTPPPTVDPDNPGTSVPNEPISDDDTVTVPLTPSPALALTKSGELPGEAIDGGEVTYTFLVENTGNVTLTDVGIDDPLLGGPVAIEASAWPGAAGELAPGQTVLATATYLLTQDDVDNGAVLNEATATGTPPTGSAIEVPDQNTVLVTSEPAIQLEKSGALDDGAVAGEAVTYSFTAQNTGNVTLTDVVIIDPLLGGEVAIADDAWPGAVGVLGPQESVTTTAQYELTQVDVDRGWVENTATATGTPPPVFNPDDPDNPVPADPIDSPPAEVTVDLPPAPAMTLSKVGSVDVAGDVVVPGDSIEYTFEVQNTGNVTLTGVTIDDPLLGGLVAIEDDAWPGAVGELAPEQVVQASASLTLTQAHIDNGWVENTASAEGTPPPTIDPDDPDNPVPSEPISPEPPVVVTDLEPAPAISLVKESALLGDAVADELVEYTFTLTNTGNVTLSDVTLTDPMLGADPVAIDADVWPGAVGELAPGAQVSVSIDYALTQSDVDSGAVINIATAAGTPPPTIDPEDPDNPQPNDPVEDNDSTTEPLTQGPAMVITKSGTLDGEPVEGGTVTYSFTAENTGNVTLSDVVIIDPLLGGEVAIDDAAWPGPVGELAPGQMVAATATYTLTQADVNSGSVYNRATGEGTPPPAFNPDDPDNPIPSGPISPPEVEDEVPLDPDPQIRLSKSGDLATAGDNVAPGDTITYTFVAENTGNVTLTDVTLTDPMLGGNLIVDADAWPGAVGELAPGQSVETTATYVLTQAHVDNGLVHNTATVTGTAPAGDPVDHSSTEITPLDPAPSITLVKSGEIVAPDGLPAVGDEIEYTLVATNTGNVTLTGVTIADDLPGIQGLTYDWSNATGTGVLAPDEAVTLTGVYVLTQADLDSGSVVNVGGVVGTPPNVIDPADPEGPGTPADEVTDEDPVTVPLSQGPALAVTKSGALDDGAVAGETVTYSFTAQNTGNVTLTDVVIIDPLLGGEVSIDDAAWPGPVGELAPSETVLASANYTLTQEDVDRGWVYNQATGEGTPPPVFDPEDPENPTPREPIEAPPVDVTVDLPPAPAMTLTKVADIDVAGDHVSAGDEVEYTFMATNTGNVTLAEVEIEDNLPGLSLPVYDWSTATAPHTLAPGEWVSATANLTLTQAHIDNGWVRNTATGTGTPPPIIDPDDPDNPVPSEPISPEPPVVVTDLEPAPAISLVKESELQGDPAADELIEYTLTATNTGNVTLTNVVISDPLLGGEVAIDDAAWPGVIGELVPGAQVSVSIDYALTQSDVDSGAVINIATAAGTPPPTIDPEDPDNPQPNDPVEDNDSTTEPLTQGPAMVITKSGTLDGEPVEGGTVTYSFTAENTGNVMLSDVVIIDPLLGGEVAIDDAAWPGPVGELAPGQMVAATATYTLTQADVDNGLVHNQAIGQGTPPPVFNPEDPDSPTPADPIESPPGEDIVELPPAPAIELVKSSELQGDAVAGANVEYTFIATNTGNVTLTTVVIEDVLPDLSQLTYDWPATSGTLAPGESVTATASYTLTQADVDRGEVVNVATATGIPPATWVPSDPSDPDSPGVQVPSDPISSPPAEDTLIVPADPAIELVKTAELSGRGLVGDNVRFTFTATNTGNVSIADVVITDPLPGLGGIVYSWPGEPGVLAPGETVSAWADYALTQADLNRTYVDNTAVVTGDTVTSGSLSDTDTVSVNLGDLPRTGVDQGALGAMSVGGVLLLLMGAVLVGAYRRRAHA